MSVESCICVMLLAYRRLGCMNRLLKREVVIQYPDMSHLARSDLVEDSIVQQGLIRDLDLDARGRLSLLSQSSAPSPSLM